MPKIAASAGCCALALSLSAQAEVRFSGLNEAQEANARALMPLAAAACDLPPWRIERLHRSSDKHLERALQALGYYEPEFTSRLTRTDECWQVNFEVRPGPPVRWGEVSVQLSGPAADDPEVQALRLEGQPETGDILHHGEYMRYRNDLLSGVNARGYFDADYTRSEVRVDREARTADLLMELEAGARYHFGEVEFTPGIINERILRNYGDIRSGEPFDNSALNELLLELNGSGYFGSVSIDTEPLDEAAKTVPVKVVLTPGPRRVYSVGLGYATDTGPQGRLDFANRRVNERGHQLDSRLFGSELRSELSASYRWPKQDPRKEWFSIVAGLQTEDTDSRESDTVKLGLRRSMKRGRSWLETRYVEYAAEDFRVGGDERSSELVIVGSNWEYARGRDVRRTLEGSRYNFDIRGASDALGSDTDFVQITASGKWIHSFDERTRVLARARLGATWKSELDELPASVRFFAGGDRSVRGYDYEALGPRDAQGNITGGSHLVELSLELERLVREQWAVAAFVDNGSAFNGSDPDFSTGVGVGLRWYSPVGPVRLDLAHPLDDPDRNLRIHVSLGLDL